MGSATAAADAQKQFKIVDPVVDRHAITLQDELSEGLQKPIKIFTLATPGCMISDSYMMSRALLKDNLKPKVVIIGVSPRDFIDSTMPYPGATDTFKFYSKYIDTSNITNAAYNDLFSLLQYWTDNLPVRKFGNKIINAITPAPQTPEKTAQTQQTASSIAAQPPAQKGALFAVVGPNGEVRPGQWLVPANIPPIWVDNTREYKNRFKTPQSASYQAEFQFFDKLLALWQANDIKTIVVLMPSLPQNRALLSNNFWQKFKQDIDVRCKQNNAFICDLSDSPIFEKSDYLDTVHLNAYGGFKLFRLISQYVVSSREARLCLTAPKENKSIASKSLMVN